MNTKKKTLSSIVRAVISSNGQAKEGHLNELRSIVGCETASKLIDMKIASRCEARSLSCNDRLVLLRCAPEMIKNGKVGVNIFGRYIALFNY